MMMAIKVMAVANGMVAAVAVVGLDEVVAATTAVKISFKDIDDCTHIKDQ